MKNVLVIGAGRFGKYTVMELQSLGEQVMLIDKDEESVREMLPYVTDCRIGNSTEEAFLRSIGVRNFDLCIVAIGDDFLVALETVSLLHELGAKKVIARAASAKQEKFYLKNGADAVVFPEREMGRWTAIRYSSDGIANYIDLMDGYGIFELPVPHAWEGKKIGELDIRKKFGLNVLGLRNGHMDMDIGEQTVLEKGRQMLVLGRNTMVRKVFSL